MTEEVMATTTETEVTRELLQATVWQSDEWKSGMNERILESYNYLEGTAPGRNRKYE